MTKHDRKGSTGLRSFGLLVGSLFGVVGLWPPIIRGDEIRLWAILIAAFFAISALLAPSILTQIHRGWMLIGHVLGWINTRIILALGYYGIVLPVAMIMRIAGKDPMRRCYLPVAKTYKIPKTSRDGTHMQRQF